MRSDLMKKGIEKSPHRSLFKAMGYTDEEIREFLELDKAETLSLKKQKLLK